MFKVLNITLGHPCYGSAIKYVKFLKITDVNIRIGYVENMHC